MGIPTLGQDITLFSSRLPADMDRFLVLSVILFCSAIAMAKADGRWVFPDQLADLTKKQPSQTTSTTPSPDVETPSPDVIFVIPNCDCPFPPQYNPVCGTDNLSYVNAQFLNCARRCGTDVRVARLGTCRGRFSVDNYQTGGAV